VSYGYRDEQRRATRVEIKRDRCFWRVVLITELIGDGQPVDFGLHTSRSVAEDLAGKMRALFLCAEPPEGLPEEVRIRDDIATCERELALYDQTWREWGQFFDAEERAEIAGDEQQVVEHLVAANRALREIVTGAQP
jgi:hypothetical protein